MSLNTQYYLKIRTNLLKKMASVNIIGITDLSLEF